MLGLLRLSISALLFCNGLRLILELSRSGYFADYFHIPLIPEAWLPSARDTHCCWACKRSPRCCAFFGVWSREALLTASSLGLVLLLCDRLQYHNNRYALLLLGFLLAFTPCDRAFLLSRGRAHTPCPAKSASRPRSRAACFRSKCR